MPTKMARSAPRSPFGLPEATAVVRAASLSCQNEGKSPKFSRNRDSIWGISLRPLAMSAQRSLPEEKRTGYALSVSLKCRTAALCLPRMCYPFCRKQGRHRAVQRRAFITLLGGAAIVPLRADAQQAQPCVAWAC